MRTDVFQLASLTCTGFAHSADWTVSADVLQHKGQSEICLINPVTSFVSFKDDAQDMSLRGQELAHLAGCAFSDQLQMELQRIQMNLTSCTY